MDKTCGTCKWYRYSAIGRFICFNEESDRFTNIRFETDTCPQWEADHE